VFERWQDNWHANRDWSQDAHQRKNRYFSCWLVFHGFIMGLSLFCIYNEFLFCFFKEINEAENFEMQKKLDLLNEILEQEVCEKI